MTTTQLLAERISEDRSELFVLSETRLQSEIDVGRETEHFYQIMLEKAKESGNPLNSWGFRDVLRQRMIWKSHGEAPNIGAEHFDDKYRRCSHPTYNYPFIPIIAIGNVLSTDSHSIEDTVKKVLENSAEDEALFIEKQMQEFVDKILGHKLFSGDLYLLNFKPAKEWLEKKRFKNESILYFVPTGQRPSVNEQGLVCTPDGTPINRNLYGSSEVPLQGLHYNQDKRRDVAIKGELDLSYVGKLTAHRNAFYKYSYPDNFFFSALGLLSDKDSEKNQGL